jgi:DNA mismatch repair ATPase MutS
VQLGHKLVVVEQLETPDQMKDRLGREKSLGKRGERTLIRGITQVVSKGTIVSFMDDKQYLPNYLIAVSKHNELIGYSLLEMGTNLIMVGLSNNLEDFKTMLFQTRPVELLYDPDNLPLEMVDLMKQSWLNMVLSRLPNR